jgi:carbonyl reductase 1
MASPQVILVTGANKGLGYGIVRSLLSSAPPRSTIYLTSRDPARGRKATAELNAIGGRTSTVVYHQLDIANQKSIDGAYEKIKNGHGRLDVLVNNASVATEAIKKQLTEQVAEEMVGINYYGTLNVSPSPYTREDES